ncbi:MAG: L-2-hydroxyglutarate oxidase [Halobacteriaceae archaeon]
MPDHDVAVVGGGAIGCSTAWHLADATELDVCLIEKEEAVATHQSGRNSGVLHPGFNYEPGSVKAEFSTAGTRRAKRYCRERGVPLEEVGVVVVATTNAERDRLETLEDQAAANGVPAEIVGKDRLATLEPHAVGEAALHCPAAASIDARQYVYALARDARDAGVTFYLGAELTAVTDTDTEFSLTTSKGQISARYLINAAGLGADRIAHRLGIGSAYRIVPFRGEYRELVPDRRPLCQSMIYPTPDPDLPFLGVHFTRRVDDRVIVGPNAVLAGGREAYGRWEIDLSDLAATLGYTGFWRLFADPQMLRVAIAELHKTYRHERFVAAARSLVPDLDSADLVDSYAGIRAQVVRRDGVLVDDPIVEHGPRSTHVLNAVSPGLTASLPFGESIAETVTDRFKPP